MIDKSYGDFMTIEKYRSIVKSGGFISYDGTGYYCTDTDNSRIETSFSVSEIDKVISEGKYSHVMWYNK